MWSKVEYLTPKIVYQFLGLSLSWLFKVWKCNIFLFIVSFKLSFIYILIIWQVH